MQDPIYCEKFTVSLVDDWLVRIECQEGAEATVDDARELCDAVDVIMDGRILPVLVDTRPMRSMSRQARVVFSDFQRGPAATLVDSPLSRTIANFYIAVGRPAHPLRLFDDESAAVAWLRDVS